MKGRGRTKKKPAGLAVAGKSNSRRVGGDKCNYSATSITFPLSFSNISHSYFIYLFNDDSPDFRTQVGRPLYWPILMYLHGRLPGEIPPGDAA